MARQRADFPPLSSHFSPRRSFRVIFSLLLGLLGSLHPPAEASNSVSDSMGFAELPVCEPSTLKGYHFQTKLKGEGLLYHWREPADESSEMALEARVGFGIAKGWFAVGWSRDGEMFPADAVAGNLPGGAVQAYSMHGESASLVAPNKSISIGPKAQLVVRKNGTKIVKFARRAGDGLVPVNLSGKNTLIWAYSEDGGNAIADHGENVGTTTIDMSCKRSAEETTGGTAPAPSSEAPPSREFPTAIPAPPSTAPLPPTPFPGLGEKRKSTVGSGGGGILKGGGGNGGAKGGVPKGGIVIGGCQVSKLKGYTFSVNLGSKYFLLHWNPPTAAGAVQMGVEAKPGPISKGWFSVGWSLDGKMAPADAVVGNLPGGRVRGYSMTGYSPGEVLVNPLMALGANATLTGGPIGGKLMEFTRAAADGLVPLKLTGTNRLIWAYSLDGTLPLGYHGPNQGRAVMDLSCSLSAPGSAAAPSAAPPSAPPSASPPAEPPTVPPVTKPPVIKPPFAKPPVTKPPVTKPPVIKPPVTKPPVAKPPTSPPSAPSPAAPPSEAPTEPPVAPSSKPAPASLPPTVPGVKTPPVGPAGGSACPASSLKGFAYKAELVPKKLVLHWTLLSPALIRFALEAKAGSGIEKGWMSVGWSADGKMYPADAVVGNMASGAIGAYTMTGPTLDTVTPTNSFVIGAASTVTGAAANGGTIVKFARATTDGISLVALTPGGNHVIWAYSADGVSQTLDNHGPSNRGTVLVNFRCTSPSAPASIPPPVLPAAPSSKPAPASAAAAAPPSKAPPAPAAALAQACSPSPLAGYSCSLKLSGDNFILHWKAVNSSFVSIAAEAATTGYVSIGWSAGGQMSPADAAIGNLPAGTIANGAAVGPYYIGGYAESDVAPSGDFVLSNTAVESGNGRTIIKFDRATSSGTVPINGDGSTTIIWAYSSQPSLSFHGPDCGSASVAFVNGTTQASTSSTSSSSKKSVLIAHGVMLAVAYALLMPLGILLSRLFLYDRPSLPSEEENEESQPNRALWFLWHKYLQLFAVVLVIAGCIMVFVVSGANGLDWTHGKLGVVVLVLTLAQPILGFMRPDKGTASRPMWLTFHWALGVGTVAMGCVNSFLGLDVYAQLYGGNQDWWYIVTAVVAGLLGLAYLGFMIRDTALQFSANAFKTQMVTSVSRQRLVH